MKNKFDIKSLDMSCKKFRTLVHDINKINYIISESITCNNYYQTLYISHSFFQSKKYKVSYNIYIYI